jgi:4-hydroxybenzoate polyprenyltransferase
MTGTIGSYLQLMRAPAVFTALSNILAAHLILTQGDIIWPALLMLMGASAALYSAGMVLNDWFDYEVDSIERPSRPLPSGKIPRNHALLFGSLLLACGVGLAAVTDIRSLYIALGIVVLVLGYDGLLKRTIAGIPVMGGCRYLNWLLGLSLLPLTLHSLLIPVPVFLYIAAITLLSREETLAKNKITALLSLIIISFASLAVIATAVLEGYEPGWKIILVLAGTAYLCHRMWLTYSDFSPANIQATMKLLILAIIPMDALLVLVYGPEWQALFVLALLLPGRLLARIMYVT